MWGHTFVTRRNARSCSLTRLAENSITSSWLCLPPHRWSHAIVSQYYTTLEYMHTFLYSGVHTLLKRRVSGPPGVVLDRVGSRYLESEPGLHTLIPKMPKLRPRSEASTLFHLLLTASSPGRCNAFHKLNFKLNALFKCTVTFLLY